MKKAILHLLLVLGSLVDTSLSYNHDLVGHRASASSCYFSGDEFLLSILLKVSLRLQP